MKRKRIRILAIVLVVLCIHNTSFACSCMPCKEHSLSTTTSTVTQPEQNNRPFMINNFAIIQATLDNLGIPNDELEKLIKEGKNLEQVLKEKHISIRKFKKEVIKEYYKAVDEGLNNGQLTKEQAEQLKTAIKNTVKGWLRKK